MSEEEQPRPAYWLAWKETTSFGRGVTEAEMAALTDLAEAESAGKPVAELQKLIETDSLLALDEPKLEDNVFATFVSLKRLGE